MFSNDSFPQTYSGPIFASGDLVRRLRSSGMAQANFAGNERAFRPQQMGIGAGSGVSAYRGGIASDAERAKGYAEGMKPLGDYERMKAQSEFDYQTGSAAEQAGIRGLLLQQRGFNQDADLSLRTLRQNEQLNNKQLRQEADIAERQRKAENESNWWNNAAKILGTGARFLS